MTRGKLSPLAKVKAVFLLLRAFEGADVLYLLGALAITAGCFEIAKALGLIVLGVFFCAFGAILNLRSPPVR